MFIIKYKLALTCNWLKFSINSTPIPTDYSMVPILFMQCCTQLSKDKRVECNSHMMKVDVDKKRKFKLQNTLDAYVSCSSTAFTPKKAL